MSDEVDTEVKAPAKTRKVEPKPEAKVVVEAVYGDMLDLEINVWYKRNQPTEVLKQTGWLTSQLAAGKIRKV